jgi:hypothetical protein
MAYVCPVCDAVEADAEHLANHLAVTASLHEGDHAAWLKEHAPDWPDRSPSELGATAVEHARERPLDDESTVHDHGREVKPDVRNARSGAKVGAGRRLDAETKQVLREARELTERSLDDPEE